jgi:L-arabinose isomerase
MEMYYGDETLRGLMEHANSFADQMENFEHIYSLSEMPAIETANDEDAGENEEAEQ